MDENKDVKDIEKSVSDSTADDETRDSRCCYVVDACGCYVDPCCCTPAYSACCC